MSAADFWSNRERAQGDVEEVSRVRSLLNPLRELERAVGDFEALRQLAVQAADWFSLHLAAPVPERTPAIDASTLMARHATGKIRPSAGLAPIESNAATPRMIDATRVTS